MKNSQELHKISTIKRKRNTFQLKKSPVIAEPTLQKQRKWNHKQETTKKPQLENQILIGANHRTPGGGVLMNERCNYIDKTATKPRGKTQRKSQDAVSRRIL